MFTSEKKPIQQRFWRAYKGGFATFVVVESMWYMIVVV